MNNFDISGSTCNTLKDVNMSDSHIKQVKTLGIGKHGLIKVIFEKKHGKTIVSDQLCESPLYFQRIMYFEQNVPSLAYMYLMSSAGGILQGDKHQLNIRLKQNSTVHITTQGATRIYSMDTDDATQTIHLTLDDGSYLEFLSDQIIPYQNSKYYHQLDCMIHDNATMFYSEIITPGRIAMGESFEYDICHLKTKVENQDKKLRFIDIVNLEPKNQNLFDLGILKGFTIVGNVYLFSTKKHISDIQKQLDYLQPNNEIIFGYSILAYDSGILIRILGNCVEPIQDLILQIVRIVRKNILNVSFSDVRKS